VTAPLFLLPAGGLDGAVDGGLVVLDGDEGRHAATVRRLRVGEAVDVADGGGVLAHGQVAAVGRDRLEVTVRDVRRLPEPAPRLVLAQALSKGGRDEQAVEAATEVGVDAVLPWQAGRSVVQWRGERGERSRRRWESTVRAASKQARRPRVPVVHDPVDTAGLASFVARAGLALLLHEDADAPLTGLPLPADVADVLVVVGPEGGIGADEVAALSAAGARAVRLGPHVLRSSTAGPVALALLAARTGRWD
jgi:16S rRNA (uracil1498-N3)-methyltransferase